MSGISLVFPYYSLFSNHLGLRKKHAAGQQPPSLEDRFASGSFSVSSTGASTSYCSDPLDKYRIFHFWTSWKPRCFWKHGLCSQIRYVNRVISNKSSLSLVLEGHSRGVNWASFHPTLPLIVSCGDDRLIKLWRMNDTKAWEVDTCRGHFNNVAGVLFHARQDVIVSASEDKTIRVWDMTKRTCISTFRREHDRFWFLTSHPSMNLFAAGLSILQLLKHVGHDSGLIVFKLERERPAYDIHNDSLYYVSEKSVKQFNFQTGQDVPMISIKRGHPGQAPPPRILTFNPAENAVLIASVRSSLSLAVY